MKKLIFTIFLNLIGLSLFCQIKAIEGDYTTRYLKFIGYKNNKPIFNKYFKNDHNQVYTIFETNNNINIKQLLNQEEENSGKLIFFHNETKIYRQFDKTYKFLIIKHDYDSIIDLFISGGFSPEITFIKNGEHLFLTGFSQDHHIKYINFSNKNIEMHNLPLLGFLVKWHGKYLYFDFYHIDKNKATPCPVDLYRVKIGDWNNPELLAEFISDTWLPLNDSIVLMTLPIKGRGKQVFYNINNKTYVETEKKLPTTHIKYEGKNYLLGVENNINGNKKYVLQPCPDIPKDGYVKDNQREILPRVLNVNLSNSQKQFSNTFITDELLYNATKEELSELSKDKLRLLRNAFFARQGYQFKSKDLQKFYTKFNWYNQLTESNKFFEISNDDIVISPNDKKRVELILEIENSK